MRRIAVINQKGGVGKTTTTANLGAALAHLGKSVLLIDLDPQGHLSLHFGVESRDEQPGIYDVLTGGMPLTDAIVHARPNADVVCADIDLAAAEAELVSVTGREVLLREALDALPTPYDAVLFDCPPSLGVLTVNALAAATEVIIPLQAHFLALQGLSKLLSTVTLVRQRINPTLKVTGVVLCMHEAATRLSAEVVADLSTFLGAAQGTSVPWAEARVFATPIRRNIKLAESSSFGQTVFDYAPKSNGALDYAALAAEVFDLPVPLDADERDAPRIAPPRLHVEPLLEEKPVAESPPKQIRIAKVSPPTPQPPVVAEKRVRKKPEKPVPIPPEVAAANTA